MYFVALLLKLKLRDRHLKLTVADGVYAHAAILNTLTEVDAEAGRKLHEMRRNKRISIALIESAQDSATLRLTFMAEEGLAYANLLLSKLATYPTLRLGSVIGEVDAVNLADPDWAGVSTWADFVYHHENSFQFRFITPTAITKRGHGHRRYVSLYPDPLSVFSGLARRWQALNGPKLPHDLEEFIESGGCVVSRYNLQTIEFSMEGHSQIGFVGRVVYKCRTKDQVEYIAALNALARLAPFTGVGYQTARGMGAVRVLTSKSGEDHGMDGDESGRRNV
jgi:CRISPR-associated endoribonuclease Cas6